jgi:hypothetical protein
MLIRRPIHRFVNAEKLAHIRHFAKGNTRLRHAPRARVHPKPQRIDVTMRQCKIGLVRAASVRRWVKHMRNGFGRINFSQLPGETV